MLADTVLVGVGVTGMAQVLDRAAALAPALTLAGALFLLGYAAIRLAAGAAPGALQAAHGNPHRAVAGPRDDPDRRLHAAESARVPRHPAAGRRRRRAAAGRGKGALVAGTAVASNAWFALLGAGARLLAPVFAKPAAWRWLDALVGA